MLAKVGVISARDFAAIEAGLRAIERDIADGKMNWSQGLEDVHMNIEAALTERIGDAGKKLHTARSRNDQVATDMRLYLRGECDAISIAMTKLQSEIVALAAKHYATIMPGFTHLQTAQAVTFGHHLLAWNEMLNRDYARMRECRARVNVCPLGAAALAGTGFPIDREMTAKELGFSSPAQNSLDAVSDRDFVMEFNSVAAMTMIHLSRIAEELILWSSQAFGFIDLGDAFCTGSSIMPQKKNPDIAELVRGKSARVVGDLVAVLMLMKAQPLAYNRDNQEDKPPMFATADTLKQCLQIYAAMLPQVAVNKTKMLHAAARAHSTATDLADYLVARGEAFRDAHAIAASAVKIAEEKNCALDELTLTALQKLSARIDKNVYKILSPQGSVNARDHIGGTAPAQVKRAAAAAQKLLAARG